MNSVALTPELRSAAPALAARLGDILLGLAALIARAFLRNPGRVGLIVPLWNHLNRAARRCGRLMARAAEGTAQSRPGRRPGRAAAPARRRQHFPATHAWLIKDLRHEAVVYALRLDRLLSDPATAAIIARTPQMARLLRPLCHMLGLRHASVPPLPPRRANPPAAATADRRATPGPVEAGPATAGPPGKPDAWEQPPPRKLHETIPCPHVRWPWFPRTAAAAS